MEKQTKPQGMALSMEKVQATRQARMQEEPRRMTAGEKDELLRRYHPDYREDGFTVLQEGDEVAAVSEGGSTRALVKILTQMEKDR